MLRSVILLLVLSPMVHGHALAADSPYQTAAAEWLYAARVGSPADSFQHMLATAERNALAAELNTDDARKAFWINIYNAATQSALKADPNRYKNRSKFFKAKLVTIAGQRLSLDEIEHGILRRSKNKLSFGYLNKWFPSAFEKKFRVDKLDYRIHFALNCGARSCPPVAFYTAKNIDEELQGAMDGHLRAETDFDSAANTASVTAFMGWFRHDFGGKAGIRRLLTHAGVIPQDSHPKIRFKKYDWDLYLNNFKEEQ